MQPSVYEADKCQEDFERSLFAKGWPSHLVKAVGDSFDYAAFVRGLGVVRFTSAEVSGDGTFVRLRDWHVEPYDARPGVFPYGCPRGIEVRVADLVWVADAPEGS